MLQTRRLPAPSPAEPTNPAATGACRGCGAALDAEFCGQCGQRRWRGRFTLRRIGTTLLTDAFDLNRGLLHTAIALTLRPGVVAREYVKGRTGVYSNPVKYCLLAVALVTFLALTNGVYTSFAEGFAGHHDSHDPEFASAAQTVMVRLLTDYANVFLLLGLPAITGLLRVAFRRWPYNLAETLIFATYVFAQATLFSTLVVASEGQPFLPKQLAYLVLAAIVVYIAIGTRQFYQAPWFTVLWRLALVMLGAIVFYGLVIFTALALVGPP